MKANKCKLVTEILFSIAMGAAIGGVLYATWDDPTFMGLGYLILLFLLPFMYQQSCTYIAGQLVRDRETKMKESLKIMGLETWIYALGMLVQRSIYMMIPSFIVCVWILAFLSDTYSVGTIFVLFIQMVFFGIGLCAFSMFISNFFQDYKLIGMALPAILYIPTGVGTVAILGPFLFNEVNTWMKFLYFFPTFPFVALMTDLLDKTGSEFYDVHVGVSWFFLIIQGPMYYFLHLYTESVLPDNYGISKHPCFCFKKRSQKNLEQEMNNVESKAEDNEEGLGKLRRIGTENFDQSDPITLKSVTMQFGKFKAVDNLSLSIK